jgi:hypothetical protein
MKLSLALLAVAMGLCVIACGSGSGGTSSAPSSSTNSVAGGGVGATSPSSATDASTQVKSLFKGDSDHDQIGDSDNDNNNDDDNDSSTDYKKSEEGLYQDKDDNGIVDYGHLASATDDKAVTALVKRYYTAAVAGDGASACSMIIPSFARAVPEDYGRATGPTYLRGGKSCPAVMSLLFKHSHQQLAAGATTLEVTGVRVSGNQGFALLGSRVTPASDIPVQREAGAWKVDALIGNALP